MNYHRTRKAIVSGVIRVAKENMATNIADILTKYLLGPSLRMHASRILWKQGRPFIQNEHTAGLCWMVVKFFLVMT